MILATNYLDDNDPRWVEYKQKHGDFGGYNDFPPGWRQISEEEFAKSAFFTYSPQFADSRQMNNPPELMRVQNPEQRPHARPVSVSATLHFMHDGTGFALVRDSWAGKVAFFAFGCDHKYVELSQAECRKRDISHMGRCWHVNECTECGHIHAYDSSD